MALGAFSRSGTTRQNSTMKRLNAPYGARYFLTRRERAVPGRLRVLVLMHLMALGAFSRGTGC